GRNPHDQLDPGTSAALVRSHVLEGIRLAEQANLPEAVKQFIPEHHGTQKIAYFLEQARRRDESVDASEFTYQGPKPQSRETAILMLADSIESAMKVLQDPTAERIRELVDRIVAGKIAEGQLEEAPLTMRGLSLIKQQCGSVLRGMYHHRIDYPRRPGARGGQEPQAGRRRELVDRLVAGKIAEGQLEEAPLTMRELSLIKQQFVSVLLGMYHHRIDYPTQQVPPPAPVAAAGRASP